MAGETDQQHPAKQPPFLYHVYVISAPLYMYQSMQQAKHQQAKQLTTDSDNPPCTLVWLHGLEKTNKPPLGSVKTAPGAFHFLSESDSCTSFQLATPSIRCSDCEPGTSFRLHSQSCSDITSLPFSPPPLLTWTLLLVSPSDSFHYFPLTSLISHPFLTLCQTKQLQ